MIALDATLRGYKVALVERYDFSSGTSSRSTNLLHGGVRYLEDAVKHVNWKEFMLVFEALHERKYMLQNAPYLTRPIATVIPVNSWFQMQYVRMGLLMYDIIAWRGGLPRSHAIKWREMEYVFPRMNFDWAKGGLVYYDGQSNDSRLNNIINRTAVENGAVSVNYMEVMSLLHGPCPNHTQSPHEIVKGVHVRDTLTGNEMDIRGKVTVNATGPFADSIIKMYEALSPNPMRHVDCIVPSKGVHLLLQGSLCPRQAGIITTTSDNRVMFMLPWQNYTLVGTTDTPCSVEDQPDVTDEDIELIFAEVNKFMDKPITKDEILAVWSGIRPLVREVNNGTVDTKRISRSHEIWQKGDGFITIAGGKWTTVRNMAEDLCDSIERSTSLPIGKCRTKNFKYVGANELVGPQEHNPKRARYFEQQVDVQRDLEEFYQMPSDVAEHLSHFYGYRAFEVAELAKKRGAARLHESLPYLEVEVPYCVQQEMAVRLSDVIMRRLRIGVTDTWLTMQCLPKCTILMKNELGWDRNRCYEELEDTVYQINKCSLKKYDVNVIIDSMNINYCV